ncbi:MAG: hypothetical protein JRF33_13385 [Deltaproteobacteria bacterium]|nr:hypothetical protein [Deltaproteobacteria bacterium]
MKQCGIPLALLVLMVGLSPACEDPKPSMTGRLNAPSDLVAFHGCRQGMDSCETDDHKNLLAIVCADSDDIRIFDIDNRSFFSSYNPLFPLTIPVGKHPVAAGKDPFGEYLFVVNGLSDDLSLVDLVRRVEVDTDWDSSTCADSLPPRSDRCRAGVSRVPLVSGSPAGPLLPEDIVVPAGDPDPTQDAWDRNVALPVWVSLSGTGQVAELAFSYPEIMGELPQRADWVQVIDLGGVPSGLAITHDGSMLFVADEMADSIAAIDTESGEVHRIDVGGPSRRLALTPDERVLYVVRLDKPLIALVDAVALTRMLPSMSPASASNPLEDGLAIKVAGVPRSIAFVQGLSVDVRDENGAVVQFTTELLGEGEPGFENQEVVKTFAYVSNLNGNIYLLDAINHRSMDVAPFLGPALAEVAYVLDGAVFGSDEMQECFDLGGCGFPRIGELERLFDGETELDPVYFGIWLTPGVTVSEGWVLTFEGVLPGSDLSSTGRLSTTGLEDTRLGLDFLTLGAQAGDHIEILSGTALDGQGEPLAACIPGGAESLRREFTINSVEASSLGLAIPAGMELNACWTGSVRYRIRSSGTWTVVGTTSGLQGRLTMLPWDAAQPVVPAYDNGYIALTLFAPGPDAEGQAQSIPRNAAFGFNTDSGFENYSFNPSIRAGVAGELISLDIDEELDDDGNAADDRLFLLYEGSNAMMEMFPSQFESTNYLLYQ